MSSRIEGNSEFLCSHCRNPEWSWDTTARGALKRKLWLYLTKFFLGLIPTLNAISLPSYSIRNHIHGTDYINLELMPVVQANRIVGRQSKYSRKYKRTNAPVGHSGSLALDRSTWFACGHYYSVQIGISVAADNIIDWNFVDIDLFRYP